MLNDAEVGMVHRYCAWEDGHLGMEVTVLRLADGKSSVQIKVPGGVDKDLCILNWAMLAVSLIAEEGWLPEEWHDEQVLLITNGMFDALWEREHRGAALLEPSPDEDQEDDIPF